MAHATTTVDAPPVPAAPPAPTRRAALDERPFRLAVAGSTAAVAAFLGLRLTAWPPHEDEALELFVGHRSLPALLDTVLGERGGAPLHFLLAWAVVHLGGGLEALRLLSAAFALASIPLIASLAARLADRTVAALAAALAAASWMLLFHGVYARMYSLFLFTSALSYLTLLQALEMGGRRRWAFWVAAVLLTVATHPYGALVLASQGAFVVVARRERLREAAWAFGAVGLIGIPFWLTDLVLAGRFDAGVSAGSRLDVVEYVWHAAGDFSAGFPMLLGVLVAVAAGFAVLPRETRLLAACAVVVPLAALVVARSTGSPETRHLIFLLPFAALAAGAGIRRLGRVWGTAALAALVVAQLAWTWDRTPELFEWEPDVRQQARADAAAYVAATIAPDDVLLGYDPLYLQARESDEDVPLVVLPRADADLALHNLLSLERPLGHGVWILDSSKTTNIDRSLQIPHVSPRPASAFVVRDFGPFLVIRTREPVVTPKRYLERAGQAMLVGKRLYLGDADINLPTIERAARALRGYGASRSLSTSSR